MSAAPQLASKSIVEEPIVRPEPGSASRNEGMESSRQAEIARLAYTLWQQRGCPVGSAELDWLEAEQQLSRPSSSTQDRPLGRTAVSPVWTGGRSGPGRPVFWFSKWFRDLRE